MKKIILIALLFVAFMPLASRAQSTWEFDYQVSFPTGKFSDFSSKPGWLGFSGQWMKYLENDRISLGANLSYFYFSDKQGRKTEDIDANTTYTGYVVNFTNIYGLMAVVQYDFKPKKDDLVPFARIGLGTDYQDQRKDVGIYEWKADGFQFMGNAEFGLRFNRGGNINWIVAATYHYLPGTGDMVDAGFFGIKLGVHGFSF
jgi:hypothetical protein